MKKNLVIVAALVAAGCAGVAMHRAPEVSDAQVAATLKASFEAKGQAGLDRLDQDALQKACTQYGTKEVPKDVAERLQAEQMKLVRLPADGNLLGDWKNGEKIAQTGVGLQYSDDPQQPAGGNCYACHELTKQEVSFGTIGPSLYRFGKIRGFTPEMRKYAYSKVYDADAFAACSNMPRFGYKHILTEQQIKDVTALLMDPASPVNQ